MAWDTTQKVNKIRVGGNGDVVIEHDGGIKPEDVKKVARDHKYTDFEVRKANGGDILEEDDFPCNEDIIIYGIYDANKI